MRVYESKLVHSKLLMWTLFAYADMFELTNYSDLFYISAQIFEKNMVWFIQFWKPKQARRLFDPLFFYMEP